MNPHDPHRPPLSLAVGDGLHPLLAVDVPQPREAVLVVPALGTPARVYVGLLRAFAAAGLAAAVVELRGTGSSPIRAAHNLDWGYADLVEGELDAALAHCRARHPQARWHLLGHSLGAQMAMLALGRDAAPRPDTLALVAAGTPHRRAFAPGTRVAMAGLRLLVRLSLAGTGVWHGDRLGFAGRQPSRLMREWTGFMRAGTLAVPAEAPRLRLAPLTAPLPTVALVMGGDRYAPVAAARELCARAGLTPRLDVLTRLPDGRAPDHFSWLRQPAAVVARLRTLWAT